MSNSQVQPETLSEYLAHLPMTDEQRAELAGCQSFSELHQRLSSPTFDAPAEAAQASGGKRLTLSTAEELEEAEMELELIEGIRTLIVGAIQELQAPSTPPARHKHH